MNSTRWATALAVVAFCASLLACGSNNSSAGDGLVRVVNATRSHATLALLANSNPQISAIDVDTVSPYSTLAAGGYTLQLTDAGTAVATTSPSVAKDTNYLLIAYESNGAVKTAWLSETNTAPAAGSASLRVVNTANDAGALDVYVTAPGATLINTSPTFTISGTNSVLATSYLSVSPGTYEVRVTASGNAADVRLDIPSVTLASQQLMSLLLTPTLGGGLVDGATVVEQAAYAAYRNTKARVRVASGVTGAVVAASTGAGTVEAGAASPYVGSYVLVPATSATWSVTVNGVAAAVPPVTLARGSDNTLLIVGTAAAASATLVADDNHAPLANTNVNLRLVNALGGTTAGLSLAADFTLISSNVVPGATGVYRPVPGNSNMRLEVTSALSSVPLSLQTGLSIPGGGVYSIFVLGDATAPATLVRRDR